MHERQVSAGRLSDLRDGEMKEVSVDGSGVLLARVDGECFAVGANCPHYGAPLAEGALSGGRIVCPWHHACFDVRTGDCEEAPAFDSLPRFEVTIDGDEILLHLPEKMPDRRTPPMSPRDPADERVFVILGGGAAGYMAAQTLREDGFTGRVLLISREDRPPYDRPNLSKDYLQGHAEPGWMPLRPSEFYEEHGIEILLGKAAARVDTAEKTITFEDGEILSFDSLLIATGGVPRQLPFEAGTPLENVLTLRSFADTDAIMATAGDDAKAVLIGASFIGMEAACSLKVRGCDVTVVAPDSVPFEKTLGTEIGRLFRGIHERNGVNFKLGSHVRNFIGKGRADGVLLENGEVLAADLVLVGVGVDPATDVIRGVGLHEDGGVIADGRLRIAEDVYAAGDIAHFPDARTGEITRIEHWRTAMQQGRTAAHNMAGKPVVFAGVPFFWTDHFGSTLRYVGHARDWDRIMFDGEVGSEEFLAYYIKDHRILAVAGMNRDADLAVWEELIRLNLVPSPSELEGRSTGPEPAASVFPEVRASPSL